MDRIQEKVLTLGIFAHANAGKTTITEHLLFHTKVIDNIGRVDYGNTVTDNMKIEQERGITVRDTLVSFKIDDKTVQLIDTPGHVDFSAEVERAINVLDGAVLVISGVEGIEAQTYTIWRALKEKNIPTIIFINKMDRLGADYEKVLNELKINLEIPTINLKHVIKKENGSLEIIDSSNEELVEELSMIDDDIIENYIEGKKLDEEIILDKIVALANDSKIFPVIGGSALIDVGIEELIDCIKKYIPVYPKKSKTEFTGYVYTVRVDDKGKGAYIKILNGQINLRDNIILNDSASCKVNSMYTPVGSKLVKVDSAYCGELVVVYGLDVKSGQVIGNTNSMEKYISFVKPLLTMEINPKEVDNNIDLMEALKILNEEDPYLNIRYDKLTNSIYCSLMGEVQAQVLKSLLYDRFGLKANIENPIVIHKETPTQISEAKATYTTVSGIGLEIKPLERGSGFKYTSKVSTDFLHLKYQRQIERLINYYSKQGLKGWELTDMEVALIDGQFDSMGSDPMHFNIITPLALFRCLKQAKTKLLEPISNFVITTPENDLGNVIKLLSNKGGVYKITKHVEGIITCEGEAPAKGMLNFPIELSMITSGRGTYSSYISKYEISKEQDIEMRFIGPDPRNETTFVINDMKASMEALDKILMKKKKESRSKFARLKKEKEYGIKK